ncbi:MAG: glycoside hydrolase 5 family protein [Phycisphaerae bacterium]
MKRIWVYSVLLSAWLLSGAVAIGQAPMHHAVPATATSKASAEKSEQKARNLKGLRTFLAQYGTPHHGKRIGFYQSRDGSWPQKIAAGLSRQLQAAGFTVRRLTGGELANPAILNGRLLPVVIVVNATTVPAGAVAAIGHYAHSEGFLVSLGGPAFSNLQLRWHGVSYTKLDLLKKLLVGLKANSIKLQKYPAHWQRLTSESSQPAEVAAITGPKGLKGYRFTYGNFGTGWDNFQVRTLAPPENNTLTVFWAKGNQRTRSLYVEWDERNGVRWKTSIGLTPHWKRYAIPESAFSRWPKPVPPGRSGPDSHLQLSLGRRLTLGLVSDMLPPPVDGKHVFYVAGIGTAAVPSSLGAATDQCLFGRVDLPIIGTISPAYKLFPVTDMKTLNVNSAQSIAPGANLPTPSSILGIYPRAQANSLDQQLDKRYVPLLEARGRHGRFVAVAAALELPSAAALPRQAITLSVPITDPSFFASPVAQQWLAAVIKRVNQGVYLADGGTRETTCFGGMSMPVGAVVMNHRPAPQTVRVNSTITDAEGKIVFQHAFTGTIAPSGRQQFVTVWTPSAPKGWENVFHVTTVLYSGGKIIDRLAGEFRGLGPVRHPHFVTAKNGLFYLRGKPWYAYGVNFWPESSMAQENWSLFLNWFSRRSYDPQTVERNLEDVKAMGCNTISVAVTSPKDNGWNLLDVLARAKELGLKVNLAIAGIDGLPGETGGPGEFNWNPVKHFINKFRLAENNTIFAYDLAWEPHWGTHINRSRFDPVWQKWIVHHYGSIKKAEALWHCRVPREDGHVTNPLDRQIIAGRRGKAAAMILAYNHFLNGLLNRCYGKARNLIRRVDPRHLVSFRMSMAGDPSANHYYDYGFYNFAGLKNVVDIFEPEGYGVMSVKRHIADKAIFTIQYARAVNPALPVIYAEFGQSAWNHITHRDDLAMEKHVARVYTRFYQALLKAGANGAICWWFPGGYRCGERSDFGIINPDRSWRPVTYVIHKFAAKMKAPRPLPAPRVWIPIRLNRVRGIRGIYQSVKKEFWAALDAGKLPRLKIVK